MVFYIDLEERIFKILFAGHLHDLIDSPLSNYQSVDKYRNFITKLLCYREYVR